MGKNKLKKFAEMKAFANVVQPENSGVATTPHALKGRWNELFFKNGNPIVLELGCGKGEYTVELARRYKNRNFIGVDIKGARMWAGAKIALEEKIENAGFLRTRIEFVSRFFSAGEVDSVWLTFPDPQMKSTKKRLCSSFFLERYRSFVKDRGRIMLKTDSRFLYLYTLSLVELNKLRVVARVDDIYGGVGERNVAAAIEPLLQIPTAYESLWRQRGLGIKFLAFELPSSGDLEEPAEEPEFDEYRSTKRRNEIGGK